MEKLLNPYDKECMKMAMLKHEETFREQVLELHRLYQIQQILMKNVGNSKVEDKKDEQTQAKCVPDEAELELTLGLGLGPTSTRTRARSTSFSSSSSVSGSSHTMKNSAMKNANSRQQEVIGWQWQMGLDHHHHHHHHHHQQHHHHSGGVVHATSRKNGPSIEDRHSNPPWLLQALSLNTS